MIILVGFLLGVILPTDGSILCWAMGNVDVNTEGLVMASILNLFLLPVIIFEAGWSMTHRDFINQLMLDCIDPLKADSQAKVLQLHYTLLSQNKYDYSTVLQ